MNGIPPGTAFDDLPPGWVCPMCYGPQILVRRTGVAPGPPCAHEEGAAHLRRRRGTVIYDRGVFIQHLLRRALPHEPETHPPDSTATTWRPGPSDRNETPSGQIRSGSSRTASRRRRRRSIAPGPAGAGGGGGGNLRRGFGGTLHESRQRMPDAFAPEVEAAFRAQMGASRRRGWTCSSSRTFSNLNELQLAARVGRSSANRSSPPSS